MNILIVTQYFWPENFRINDLSLRLKERGHTITVLTGKPNYPMGSFFTGYNMFDKRTEYWNDILILRSPLFPRGKPTSIGLMLNYFSFAFFASFRAFYLKQEYDKILVFEPSPVTVGIPAIISKFKTKAPIYFWVQDLWPESISAAGEIRNRFILSLFNSLTLFIYKKCHRILVQSEGFIPYIVNQGINKDKIIYFPNTAEPIYRVEKKHKKFLSKLPKGFILMFAGNIGKGQSFDTLIKSAALLKQKDIPVKWVILGDGKQKKIVKMKITENNLEDSFFMLGSFPIEEMPYFFACADALLVSLKDEPIFSLTIPSKLQSYLACGKPIIGSLNGIGASIIEQSKSGFVASAENHFELSNQVTKLFKMDEDQKNILGKNARHYYEKNFEGELLLNKLEEIFSL